MTSKEQLKAIVNNIQIIDSSIWDEFSNLFYEKEIKKGEYFIKTGQYTSQVGFIDSGVFRAYFMDMNGHEINNVFFLQHNFIIARLKPVSKSSINIQCIKDGMLLTADVKAVFALADKYHSVSKLLLKIAAYYFDKNIEREIKLRIQNATENYLYFLNEYPDLINEIPHYYVADYLQISSTHLSRIRRELSSNK